MKSLKYQSHSVGELLPTHKFVKKNSVDSTLSIKIIPVTKEINKLSPRLQAVHDLLLNSTITKEKKIGEGYGNNTTIWKVSVKINTAYDKSTIHNLSSVEKNLEHCCMKELSIDNSCTEDVKSFLEEVNKLSRLPSDNDHIIKFIGYQETLEHIRVFTKLYNGSLRNIIAQMKDKNILFTQDQIFQYMKQISSGLSVLHSRRMMHRDLKSANIFYEGTLDDFNLVLGDFGESKVIDRRNKAKTCVGTNVWIAPEVLNSHNKNVYSFSADVYSFGMVVYEMMTLHTPFGKKRSFSAITKILKGDKPDLTEDQKEKYSDVLLLWNQMIDFFPEKRPTAGQIYCDLLSKEEKILVDL